MAGDHFLNLQPGTIVNGRYEVVKCLGTGSMGMVYACRHRELAGHLVAMKVLFPEVARDEVAAARFRNEIVASYGVSHPNVVRAYEYFRDGDLIAFTMEYIPGGDIADKIANSDKITIDEILRMLSQICSGVQAIHDAGIIHRDLKPENILLTAQGDVKITDFGIARAGTGPRLTDHGGVVGTIDYVSPEYLERGEVDARSDIYAMGVISYEMLTHELPFKGKSVIETMTLRLRTDPEPPHRLRADCPPKLSEIVLKAMARDFKERYQSAREMYEDLQDLIRSRSARSRTSGTQPTIQRENGIRPTPRVVTPAEAGRSSSGLSVVSAGGGHAEAVSSPESGSSARGSRGASPGRNQAVSSRLEEDELDPFGYQMESVLSGPRTGPRPYVSHAEDSSNSHPAVAISQSHLSAERLKALATDYKSSSMSGTWIGNVVSAIVIFFLGFGVGWMLLKHFKPELFDPPVQESTAVPGSQPKQG